MLTKYWDRTNLGKILLRCTKKSKRTKGFCYDKLLFLVIYFYEYQKCVKAFMVMSLFFNVIFYTSANGLIA